MKIAIGCDHTGISLKAAITKALQAKGHEVMDLGSFNAAPVDYPDFAAKVAQSVAQHESERGIMICGSGIGASVVANKFKSVRAGISHDTYSARQGVEHDDMNVLVLGARVVGSALALCIVDEFIAAKFTGEERHLRRLKKIQDIENHEFK